MDSSNQVAKDELHDWIENETRALDVVASWENLCDVYRSLEFNDPISDSMRLEEFKCVIENMNRFLTNARKKLLNCTDPDSMREMLDSMFVSEQMVIIRREQLTYQKLRQLWISKMLVQLESIAEMMKEKENGEREDYWND